MATLVRPAPRHPGPYGRSAALERLHASPHVTLGTWPTPLEPATDAVPAALWVQRTVHRTELRKHTVHALRDRPLFGGRPQQQSHVNAPEDEHPVRGLLDFSDRLAAQPLLVGLDPARLQRASEGPRESAGHRGDDVVERGRVGLEGARSHLV